jgi:hypothetical protein
MHDQDNFDSQIMIWKLGWFGEGVHACKQDGHLKFMSDVYMAAVRITFLRDDMC